MLPGVLKRKPKSNNMSQALKKQKEKLERGKETPMVKIFSF